MKRITSAVIVAIVAAGCGGGATTQDGGDDGGGTGDGEPSPDADESSYRIFNPADYPGYDPTGQTESSAAFQAAIDAASEHASAGGDGLYTPPALTKDDGTVVGPMRPQAIVRTDPGGVFKLSAVYLKARVRLEIHASSTLIPIRARQQVMIQGMRRGGETSGAYIDDVTITARGTSATFADTGRRCDAAGLASPCQLPKEVRYAAMRFADGKGWHTGDDTDLDRRFVIDLDYRRYPDTEPPSSTGDAPRGAGIKLRETRYFLVEKVLELAHPGVVLHPDDDPSGPGGIGSNTYPATAGNGFAMEAANLPAGEVAANSEDAFQPRHGTVRHMHCEGCTRGYGIMEIHAGVDILLEYISNRGGISVRWESAGGGKSTRQTARHVVGYDCNTPLLMSAHDYDQEQLEAAFVTAIGCDNGFRSETTGGVNRGSSVTNLDVYAANAEDPGGSAQVILCRFDACDDRYGSVGYDDDAWNFAPAQRAINNNNDQAGTSITLTNVRCTPPATFAQGNVGYGACGGL